MVKNKRLIFVGLASLSCVGGLAGYLCFKKRREKEMSKLPREIYEPDTPEKLNEKTELTKGLSNRERKELQDRIKAMSLEEMFAVVEAIPVGVCLARIESEIKKAADIQASITRAYEMVKQ